MFAGATHASRPPSGSAGSQDAHRQTTFVLAEQTDLVLAGLELESAIAEGASGGKTRNQLVASSLAFWSRSWLARLDALHAIEWGNYVAAMALIRSAADFHAACLAMLAGGVEEWNEWLAEPGIALAPAHHALEFQLHAFRSAEGLMGTPELGAVYRIATDLSLPHFGATILAVASESDPSRVAVTFGDRDFHLGWAELGTGLLQRLGAVALAAAVANARAFAFDDPSAASMLESRLRTAAVDSRRCRAEHVEIDGTPRLIIHDWRRHPGGSAQRILL